ncbi:methylcytosine dioxygenase TET2 [Paramormyrops kingsleyae]|uniref:methylcytosine dioxygenase TET2 n=1 Tax=Paramormyrops kingsleyae TaxID=1676925 RepID=UPI003B9750D1
METEKANHETEETLQLVQFNSVLQPEKLVGKLQNGSQLEMPSHQLNGNADCHHFKRGAGINRMKRLHDSCTSPADAQDVFDQGSCLTNGELKHAICEPGLQELHQVKKLKTDSKTNEEDNAPAEDAALASWDKKEQVDMESEAILPGLTKPAEFTCDVLLTEQKLEKKSCSFSNGDIFSLSKNKQVPISNGATVNSSMGDTPGELLEKTLSQYYPDHVSIAPQSITTQENDIRRPLASDMPEQATPSPPHTSGVPVSSQMSVSGHQNQILLDMCNSNVYNAPFSVNGYPSHVGKGHHHQQDQPYPLNPDRQVPEGTGTVPPTEAGNGSQDQNGDGCFQLADQKEYLKSNQESLPLTIALKSTTPMEEAGRFSPFSSGTGARIPETEDSESSHQFQGAQMGQWPGQYAATQTDRPKPSETSSQQEHQTSMALTQPDPPKPNDISLSSTEKSSPPSSLIASQTPGPETENKMPFNEEAREATSQQGGTYRKVNWIDLNSSPPSRPLGPPWLTWESLRTRSQHEPGRSAPNQGQSPGTGSVMRFPVVFSIQSGFQQQGKQMPEAYSPDLAQSEMQYNTPYTRPGQPAQSRIPGNRQHVPLGRSGSPEPGENPFGTQTQREHLDEHNQDIEDILSPNFLQKQQSPPPHPPQTAMTQCAPHPDASQLQDSIKRRAQTHPLDRFKLEEYMENQLKPDYQPQNQAEQPQVTGPNPSCGNNPGIFGPRPTSTQPPPNDSLYGSADGAVAQDSTQQQMHYPRQLSHTEFQESPMQPQSQLSQGALNPQLSGQSACPMQPKAEVRESCSQFPRGPPPGYPYGDLQSHAALRMHFYQRQGLADGRPPPRGIKIKDGPRCAVPLPQQAQGAEKTTMPSVKQEPTQVPCGQGQRSSIIATMEQQLKQYQHSLHFERTSLVMKDPSKIKVESSGAVTVLSTNTNLSEAEIVAALKKSPADRTPTKKEPNLNLFLESPMKLLNTPVKTQYDIPSCRCVEQLSEKDEGPYYTHLGTAPNIASIRELMEARFGQKGSCIRIEKVVYTGKEGKSTQGCPIAKWVIRRSSVEEKLLVLVRERAGHSCATACLVVAILLWEGIPTSLADRLYSDLSETLRKHGALTNRRCALNEERTCACQGLDQDICGASFSFGCSWSMYYNGCKFARSKIPRKFKLLGDDLKEEEKMEQNLQNLATLLAPTYKQMAPDAYGNQVEYEHRALDCRLGVKEGRPFSGVTACLDFCAHAHRDLHNMHNGSTVVCTLTREDNREIGKIADDEQLHVLPLYTVSPTDEHGSEEGQQAKMKSGAIQVLSSFRRQVRMLAEPAKSCRQKKLDARRTAANKPSNPDAANTKAEKTLQAKLKQGTYENPGQSTPVSGSLPGQGQMVTPQPAHQAHPPAIQQQQQQQQPQQTHPHPYPGSPHPASYPRFANHVDSFPSTSQTANTIYPQSSVSSSPYSGPLPAPNTYLNGSNPANSYPGNPQNPSSLYPGYFCRGSMPMDSFHPYYGSNPKHLDMYRLQRPQLYPQQQYGAHQAYGVSLPARYSESGLQANGYGGSATKSSIHPMGYPTYSPNGSPNPQLLEAISRPPLEHPNLDYANTMSKGMQYGAYPNPYLAQNSTIFSPGQGPLNMQNKPNANLHSISAIPQVLPPPGRECPTPTQPGCGLPNGNAQETQIKQEPGPQPPDPKQKEDVWSDNEHNFLDPEIGGVAIAPSHGSILIECAKRELHATTPVKNPNRNHPTRISLVFYQHKNMNEAKHGLALWEAKMAEKAREKEEEAEKHGAESAPSKSKKVKREHSETVEHGEPPYKRFIQTLNQRSMSCTTNTYVSTAPYAYSKITGPYNRFI